MQHPECKFRSMLPAGRYLKQEASLRNTEHVKARMHVELVPSSHSTGRRRSWDANRAQPPVPLAGCTGTLSDAETTVKQMADFVPK